MNILMMTNTFTPHVGVARSVEGYTDAFRRLGHRVLVAAPLFKGSPEGERDVVRFPAVRDFNGSDFSVPVPNPLGLLSSLKAFRPEVVHAHHPFLLGGTALRVATARDLPLVFTHHTWYEQYTHYVPGDSQALKRFAIDLVTGYCNLCDAVIAPSRAVGRLLEGRGVRSPIAVIPTGIRTDVFARGDGRAFRRRLGIPERAFVVGHVGRLAPEKNLSFLTEAVARFLQGRDDAFFVLVGAGPAGRDIRAQLEEASLAERLIATGVLEQPALAAAYRAMDVFAFASRTETQGMVLYEAMAAGVPVVALEATGADELVVDERNGRLLRREDGECYAAALAWVADLDPEARRAIGEAAGRSARAFDITGLARQALDLYGALAAGAPARRRDATPFPSAARRLRGEWRLLYNIARAAGDSMRPNAVWEIGPAGEGGAPGPSLGTAIPPLVDAPRPSRKARLLGWIWSACLRLQCATWRKHCEGLERLDRVLADGRPVLFCFWHGKYVPLFALLRGRPACVFTTQSARGEIIAEVCRRFGYACVQVPARSQGQAYEIMRRALSRHANGGIAVDGPLGPYHRVKRGAVKLASELGYLVVPASASARRKRVFRHRWDRLELPGLFTHVGLAVGEPLEVPAGLGAESAHALAVQLRTALEALDRRGEQLAGITARPADRRALRAAGGRPPVGRRPADIKQRRQVTTWLGVPLSAIVFYALPYMSYAVVALPLALFVPSFYADELGLPLAIVGYAIAASRVLDILLDPLIGTLSDHTRTRFGRRKPWIVAGTPLFLLAAWRLLVPGEGVSATYLLVWTTLLFVSFTLVDLPYKAWGAELSTDYGERSRITAWRETFGFAGQLVFVAVLLLLELTGPHTAHIQLQAVAWTLALTLPPLLALALWVVPEPRPEELRGRRPQGWGSLRVMIKNPALQRLLMAVVLFVAAVVVQATLHRLVLAHVILSPEVFTTLLLVENVVTIAAVPLWMRISHRIGKHRALSAAALWAGLWSLALPFFYAGQAWELCAVLVVRGSSFASILFLANSIAADVVDDDTVASGHQRTGLLFALWAVTYKLAIALGILLATVIPASFGFEPSAPSHDESAKLALMGVYGWLPGILMGLGALALWHFPIDEARQRALRALIAERVVR